MGTRIDRQGDPMTDRVKLRCTITVEYTANPVYYNTDSISEMIALDMEHMDLHSMIENDDVKFTIEEVKE